MIPAFHDCSLEQKITKCTSFSTTSCSFYIAWFDYFLWGITKIWMRLLIYCDPIVLKLRQRTSVAWKFMPKNCMIPNRSYIHNLLYPKVSKIGCQRWPYLRVEIKKATSKRFWPHCAQTKVAHIHCLKIRAKELYD